MGRWCRTTRTFQKRPGPAAFSWPSPLRRQGPKSEGPGRWIWTNRQGGFLIQR